jgi:phage recombination protein Bet
MSNLIASLPQTIFGVDKTGLQQTLIERFSTGGKSPDLQSLAMFLYTCQQSDLNPLKGQAFLIPFNGKWTTCVSFQGLVTIAERTERFGGFTEPLYLHPEKGWIDHWVDKAPPLAVKVAVKKLVGNQITESWAIAYFSEYNKGNSMWKEKPVHMLLKVAKSIAVRDAFPDATSGLYSREEMIASGYQEEVQQAVYEEVIEDLTNECNELIGKIKFMITDEQAIAKFDQWLTGRAKDRKMFDTLNGKYQTLVNQPQPVEDDEPAL